MLVMPKKARRIDHDFFNLYNTKIFKEKKKDKVVKIIGVNEKTNAFENIFESRKSTQVIKFSFNGLKGDACMKESP